MDIQLVKGTCPVDGTEIDKAVVAFARESDIKGDFEGFVKQSLTSMAQAVLGKFGDLWLAHKDGAVEAYVTGYIATDIDDKPTYWLTQAWVAPSQRGKADVRECFQKIRAYAKEQGCAHMVVVSSRGTEAYCRFLGKGWHEYARLLKEDI